MGIIGLFILGVVVFVAILRFMLGTPVRVGGSGWVNTIQNRLNNRKLVQIALFGGLLFFWGLIIDWGAWFLHQSPFGTYTGLSEEALKFGLFLLTGTTIVGFAAAVAGQKTMGYAVNGILIAVCATGLLWGTLNNLGLNQEASLGVCNLESQLDRLGNGQIKTIPAEGVVLTICPDTPVFALKRDTWVSSAIEWRFETSFRVEHSDVLNNREPTDFVRVEQYGDMGNYYKFTIPRSDLRDPRGFRSGFESGLTHVKIFVRAVP
jgi:hypothetical protein